MSPKVPVLMKEDIAVGALDAAIVSLGFTCSLGFHPIVPIVSFVDGVLGRHQSRLRATIATKGGDGVASNSAALLTHTAIGTLKMGAILNPIAGFGLGLRSIAAVSFSHSLSKGSFRVVFDKTFSDTERRRVLGVAYGSLLNFGQSLLIGLVYKGSGAATAMQVAFAAGGAALLFTPVVKKKVQQLRMRRRHHHRAPQLILRHVSLQSAARPHASEAFALAELPSIPA